MLLSSLRPIFQLYPLFQFGTAGRNRDKFLGKDDVNPLSVKEILDVDETQSRDDVPESVAPQSVFDDLPRAVRPDGTDDTDEIKKMVMKAFPDVKYFRDQTNNRRNLYLAILKLRTQTTRPWILDEKPQTKSPYPVWSSGPSVLKKPVPQPS